MLDLSVIHLSWYERSSKKYRHKIYKSKAEQKTEWTKIEPVKEAARSPPPPRIFPLDLLWSALICSDCGLCYEYNSSRLYVFFTLAFRRCLPPHPPSNTPSKKHPSYNTHHITHLILYHLSCFSTPFAGYTTTTPSAIQITRRENQPQKIRKAHYLEWRCEKNGGTDALFRGCHGGRTFRIGQSVRIFESLFLVVLWIYPQYCGGCVASRRCRLVHERIRLFAFSYALFFYWYASLSF